VTSDKGPAHVDIVKTAAAPGIRFAKLGHYRYDASGRIERDLREVKPRLREAAALFRQHGVTAGSHNHSGSYVGAPMWDL
jgi:L-ribulose-5-phosphate 3-epimerase